MGDHEDGLPSLGADAPRLSLQSAACQGIQRGKRLVHQEDFRLDGQRAGNAHTLLHAA